MGNCQATQVTAAVVVQHPRKDGKVDKMYLPVQANEVMRSNPGHYVALVVESPNVSGNVVVKQLKLLKPTDMLHIGHVYRLITFEDVIKEFTTKKSVKLGKLLKESGVLPADKGSSNKLDQTQTEKDGNEAGSSSSSSSSSSSRRSGSSRRGGRHHGGGGHWKPALQTISEV